MKNLSGVIVSKMRISYWLVLLSTKKIGSWGKNNLFVP